MQNDLLNVSHNYSNDEEELYFEISYINSGKINYKEKKELIEKSLDKVELSKNICEVISKIKTIYSKQIIKGITLYLYGDDDRELNLKYNEDELVLYESKYKFTNRVIIKTKHDSTSGTQFNLVDNANTIKNLSSMQTYNSIATKELKTIYELKNIKPRELSKNDLTLCTIYKAFYDENPDFSRKETKTKTHAMLLILSCYGIVLGEKYLFSVTEKNKFPISNHLTELMENLVPFGKINLNNKNIMICLPEKIKKIITAVGNEVKENTNSEEELIAKVSSLSSILHAKKYILAPNAGVEEISSYINSPKEEIDVNLKLIKKISSNLKQNN